MEQFFEPVQIAPGVYLGDMHDARIFPGETVCVHEQHAVLQTKGHWIPIMTGEIHYDEQYGTWMDDFKAERRMLNAATDVMRFYQDQGKPVMVHCAAGVERSPLTAAWFLKRFGYVKSLPEAYKFLIALRPCVADRTCWLNDKGTVRKPRVK